MHRLTLAQGQPTESTAGTRSGDGAAFLPQALHSSLARLGAEEGVTLSAVLVAAAAALTFRCSAWEGESSSAVDPEWSFRQLLRAMGPVCRPGDFVMPEMPDRFLVLLEGVAKDPNERICRLPLLTEPERRKLLVDWNDTAADYPAESCVHELVEAQARRTPDAIAAIHGRRQLTYSELDGRANQLARYLQKRGAGPGAIVGVALDRSLNLAVALLAVLKAGAACMPLDPAYPAARLEYMQHDARATLVVTESVLREAFSEPGTAACADAPRSGAHPDAPAYVVYTSGSTGQPRGILLAHRGLVNHHTAIVRLYGLTAADRVLQFSSISFDIAIEEIFPAWISGAAVVFRQADVAMAGSAFLDWIEEQGITVLDLPTAYWHEWVHDLTSLGRPLPRGLRLVGVGGEKASAAVFRKWTRLSRGRVRWINSYGPSEASVIATACEPLGEDVPAEIPIGRPIANNKIYLLDCFGQPVPPGVRGELYIGGPGVALGYLNRPALTAEKFLPDPFSEQPGTRMYRTGDMARFLPDGNVEFRGRTDDQVKIRGFRVELGEIEAVLGGHPGVREVAVVAPNAAAGGRRLVAYVTAVAAAPTVSELRAFLKDRLPDYMVPSAFAFLKSMPLSPNGKIDRRALPEPQAQERPELGIGRTSQPGTIEAQLAAIWEDLLGAKSVTLDDNFFDLGGSSLSAIQLMHRVVSAFGKQIPLMAVFQAPTVEQLADILRRDDWAPSSASLVAMRPSGSRPPFFLVHGMGGAVLRFRDLVRHFGPEQPVYALQAQGLDGINPFLTRVEDMAVRYVDEIRTVQPSGPYYLGGYSFGGFVALEMAQRLAAAGEETGLLVLLDTFPPGSHSRRSMVARFLRWSPVEQAAYIVRKARKKIRRTLQRVTLPEAVKNVRAACAAAEREYVPQPYGGPMVLFRPLEKSLRSGDDRLGGWGPLAFGQTELRDIPGDHGGVIDDPHARLLAASIEECLERAQASATHAKETVSA